MIKSGIKTGYSIGSKVIGFLLPIVPGIAFGFGAYEVADHITSLVPFEISSNIEMGFEYGSAGVFGLAGAGLGWLVRATYIPKLACGITGGIVGEAIGGYVDLIRAGHRFMMDESIDDKVEDDKPA